MKDLSCELGLSRLNPSYRYYIHLLSILVSVEFYPTKREIHTKHSEHTRQCIPGVSAGRSRAFGKRPELLALVTFRRGTSARGGSFALVLVVLVVLVVLPSSLRKLD